MGSRHDHDESDVHSRCRDRTEQLPFLAAKAVAGSRWHAQPHAAVSHSIHPLFLCVHETVHSFQKKRKTPMRSSKHLFLALVVSFLGLATAAVPAHAEIVFRVAQLPSSSPIEIPDTATFAVTLESTTGSQVITGVDFDVNLSAADETGGVITGGANELFATGGFFVSDFPGTVIGFSTFDVAGATMTASPTQIATFTLDTSDALVAPGDYTISLSALLVTDGSFGELGVSGVPVTYTLVPEPSTMALVGLACGGLGLTGLSRRKRLFRGISG
jgi:hypothetical protein